MKTLIVCSLLCLAAPASSAAHLYKSVSTSGKVTYADRPTDERYSNVSVMGAAGLEPAETPVSSAAPSGVRAARAGGSSAGPVIISSTSRNSGDKLDRVDIEIKADGRMIVAKGIALPVGQAAAGVRTSR